MAEELFQAEVCSGSWWSSPIMGSCWLQNDFMNMKTRSTDDFSGGCAATILPDSAGHIMGSSPSTTTNCNGRTGESCGQTLPEILNSFPDGGRNLLNININMDDQEQPSNFITTSGDCTGNLVTTSYDYPSSLLQTFLDGTSSSPPPVSQQPMYDVQANFNEFDPVSSMSGFSSTNKTFFWNDINDNRAGLFSAYEEKPKCPNIKLQNETIRDGLVSSVKKNSSESSFKRPRLETPSPLPTFKVRKEKLGDRVTALQQLVSPFGKTDTASVLHEAIEYIKLLHDQVNVLSNPYMKNGAAMQVQQINDEMEDNKEGAKQQGLRSRGLCLVPVSSTFPVASETAPDYWTLGFRSTFN